MHSTGATAKGAADSKNGAAAAAAASRATRPSAPSRFVFFGAGSVCGAVKAVGEPAGRRGAVRMNDLTQL